MGGTIDEDHLIAEFIAAPKVVATRILWVHPLYQDTAKGQSPLIVPQRPSFNASIRVHAHVSALPPKYSFSLLLGGERVAGLDVNPNTGHWNFLSGKRSHCVRITHWHEWPDANVKPDERELRFSLWMKHFCKRFLIDMGPGCAAPPFLGGEQIRMF